MFVSAESQQQPHSGQITDTWSYNTFQKVEFEQGESPAFHLKPAISLPNCQQKHEWFEVNQHIEVHTAPRVYTANTVEEKKAILSEDLYDHLHGTQIWYSSTKYKEIMEKATQPD